MSAEARELRRMTFAVPVKTDGALREIMAAMECNQTDAITRALLTQAYLLREIAAGNTVVIHNPATGESRTVVFL